MSAGSPNLQDLPFKIPTVVQTIFYVVIMVMVVLGNSLVVLSVAIDKVLWTVTNMFIVSLSCADLLVGFFVIPSTIGGSDEQGNTSFFRCIFMPYFQLLSVSASVYFMLAIAVDRYRVFVGAQKMSWTKRFAAKVICGIWVGVVCYSCRIFLQILHPWNSHFGSDDDDDDDDDGNDGHFNQTEVRNYTIYQSTQQFEVTTAEDVPKTPLSSFCDLFVEDEVSDIYFRVLDFFIIFLIPMILMMVLYGLVIQRLWGRVPGSTGASRSLLNKGKAITMFTSIMCLFGLCWLPWHLVNIIADTMEIMEGVDDGEEEEEGVETMSKALVVARFLTTMLAISNSFMSPLIYMIFNRILRDRMLAIVTCKRFRKKRVAPLEVACKPVHEAIHTLTPIARLAQVNTTDETSVLGESLHPSVPPKVAIQPRR